MPRRRGKPVGSGPDTCDRQHKNPGLDDFWTGYACQAPYGMAMVFFARGLELVATCMIVLEYWANFHVFAGKLLCCLAFFASISSSIIYFDFEAWQNTSNIFISEQSYIFILHWLQVHQTYFVLCWLLKPSCPTESLTEFRSSWPQTLLKTWKGNQHC